MEQREPDSDALLAIYDAVLREVAGYPITAERLRDAGPLIAEIIQAIRTMDEVDLSGAEPMTVFRPLP